MDQLTPNDVANLDGNIAKHFLLEALRELDTARLVNRSLSTCVPDMDRQIKHMQGLARMDSADFEKQVQYNDKLSAQNRELQSEVKELREAAALELLRRRVGENSRRWLSDQLDKSETARLAVERELAGEKELNEANRIMDRWRCDEIEDLRKRFEAATADAYRLNGQLKDLQNTRLLDAIFGIPNDEIHLEEMKTHYGCEPTNTVEVAELADALAPRRPTDDSSQDRCILCGGKLVCDGDPHCPSCTLRH